MKITYTFETIECGGAEQLILNVCREIKLSYPAYEIELIVLRKVVNDLESNFREIDVPVKFLDINQNSTKATRFFRLFSALRHSKPDIIHNHAGTLDRDYMFIAWLAGVKKRFFTVHNMDQKYTKRALFNYRIAAFFANRIIAVTHNAKKFYLSNHFYPDNITVIYNCASFKYAPEKPRTIDLEKDTIQLINIGAFRIQKGQLYLVRAMKILESSGLKFHLSIYGADRFNYKKVLVEEIEKLKISNISLMGESREIKQKLLCSDIFIGSSIKEAAPLVLLEALTTGTPAIVTDIPAHREIMEPIGEKIIVPPQNPEEIAEAILKLAQNKILYEKMATEELKRSRDFTLESCAANHIALYNSEKMPH